MSICRILRKNRGPVPSLRAPDRPGAGSRPMKSCIVLWSGIPQQTQAVYRAGGKVDAASCRVLGISAGKSRRGILPRSWVSLRGKERGWQPLLHLRSYVGQYNHFILRNPAPGRPGSRNGGGWDGGCTDDGGMTARAPCVYNAPRDFHSQAERTEWKSQFP